MEERTNKSNTMLLTVIAIATLLVAVIGATFAYFTAQVGGAESASTVIVEGVQLTITFGDGTATLLTDEALTPNKDETAVLTKAFTISGVNPTAMGNNGDTGRAMPYTLYLIVTNNTFQLKKNSGHTSLTWTLASSGTGAATAVTTKQDIKPTTADTTSKGATWISCPTGFTCNDTLTGNITLHDNNGNPISGSTNLQGVLLGTAEFAAQSNKTAVTHSYTLSIYFDEIDENQDYDKNAVFEGYVAIDASGAITPNS